MTNTPQPSVEAGPLADMPKVSPDAFRAAIAAGNIAVVQGVTNKGGYFLGLEVRDLPMPADRLSDEAVIELMAERLLDELKPEELDG